MLDVIRRVGIFIICAQMIVHLKPNESYEKYLKLLMSVMVMVQIIFPVMQLLGSKWDEADFADRMRAYGQALQGERKDADLTGAADEILEEYTLREIQSRLAEQAREEEDAQGSNAQESGGQGGSARDDGGQGGSARDGAQGEGAGDQTGDGTGTAAGHIGDAASQSGAVEEVERIAVDRIEVEQIGKDDRTGKEDKRTAGEKE